MLSNGAFASSHDRSSTMTQTTQSVSPLRQRMIDDMIMRKPSPKIQSKYIRAVKNLTRYLSHAPDTATAEELRKYQLSMVNDGISRITLNANLTALKFFFVSTLDRADRQHHTQRQPGAGPRTVDE